MFGSHQGFADQERVITGGAQTGHVRSGMNSAFRYADAVRRNLFSQAQCRCEIDFESFQVTAIDSDQVASGIESALQLCFVVDFAQHIQLLQLSGAR